MAIAAQSGHRRDPRTREAPHAGGLLTADADLPSLSFGHLVGLGHCNLGVTSIYLQGIDSSEIIDTVHSRPAPVISATSGLRIAR